MSDVLAQPSDDHDLSDTVEESAGTNATTERSSQETQVRGTDRDGSTRTSEETVEADVDGSAAPAAPSAEDAAADDDDDADADDPESTLEGEAEIAADYLEELLDIADLDGDIDTYIEGERAHVSIVSDSEVLVGPKGEVLDALQELTRLAVMTETGDRSRLMLDVAGFRDRRRQQLVAQATAAVDKARSSQTPVPLEPMNPFERKIVHDAVAAAGLSSESEGDEPNRHVVVQPQA